MKLLIRADVASRLESALEKAGTQEIGGVLMGEHVADGVFAVQDLTVQTDGGTFAAFLRSAANILAPLYSFFKRTKHDYRRFNYLGEWHSHPSFLPEPSSRDLETMRALVEDEELGANFAVLLIVRLRGGKLTGTVTAFAQGGVTERAEVVIEGGGR